MESFASSLDHNAGLRESNIEKIKQMLSRIDVRYQILSQEEIDKIIEASQAGLTALSDELSGVSMSLSELRSMESQAIDNSLEELGEVKGDKMNLYKFEGVFGDLIRTDATDQELIDILDSSNGWIENPLLSRSIMADLSARSEVFNHYFAKFISSLDELDNQEDPQRALTQFMHGDHFLREIVDGLDREDGKELFQMISRKCKDLSVYDCYGKVIEVFVDYGLAGGESIEDYGFDLGELDEYQDSKYEKLKDSIRDALPIDTDIRERGALVKKELLKYPRFGDSRIDEDLLSSLSNIEVKSIKRRGDDKKKKEDITSLGDMFVKNEDDHDEGGGLF